MTAIPSTIALSQPPDASPATASVQRSDNSATQTAVNGLIGWAQTVGGGTTTYRKVSTKAVNTTTSATDLLNGEITIAAGALATTGMLRLTVWGDVLNNSGSSVAWPRMQLVFGGTTLIDSGTGGPIFQAGGSVRWPWKIVAEILNAGATNAQVTVFKYDTANQYLSGGGGTFTTGEGGWAGAPNAAVGQVSGVGVNSTTVDTTVACALVLNTINGSANAAYETKLFGAVVELI